MAVVLGWFGAPATLGQSAEPLHIAMEIGLTPEALIVADFLPQEARTIVMRLEGATAQRTALAETHAALSAQVHLVTSLREQANTNPGDGELRQDLAEAESQLTAVREALATAQQALRDVVLNGFAQQDVARLTVYRDGVPFKTPPEYRVGDRSDAEWLAIEAALRAEARATRRGEALEAAHAQLLAGLRADPDVQAAAQRLAQGTELMESAFDGE